MNQPRGLSCPVLVPEEIDWARDFSATTLGQLAALRSEELAAIDPVGMNLVVAKGIPALSHLDIGYYQDVVNRWVADFAQRCLLSWEPYFYQSPADFKNDIRYFRLGMVCQYLELELGIQYNQDQRELQSILYTNASDLFLNGVIDTGQGTCGNLAALQLAFGWRLGWPVSLARVNSHFILRFDDGDVTYNIEATQSGYGGFKSDPDDYLIETRNLPLVAVQCGSDLRALRPHEVLGCFVGLRARHLKDLAESEGDEAGMLESEADWLLARHLFPRSRVLYKNQMAVSTMRGGSLFDPNEPGHPSTYVACVQQLGLSRARCSQLQDQRVSRNPSSQAVDRLFTALETNQ